MKRNLASICESTSFSSTRSFYRAHFDQGPKQSSSSSSSSSSNLNQRPNSNSNSNSDSKSLTIAFAALPLSMWNPSYVLFHHPVSNKIMSVPDGTFTRIMYANEFATWTNVYLYMELDATCSNDTHSLFTLYSFAPSTCQIIEPLIELEHQLLQQYGSTNKTKDLKLRDMLSQGVIKCFHTDQVYTFPAKPPIPDKQDSTIISKTEKQKHAILLKISGIWENAHQIGLICKFVHPI